MILTRKEIKHLILEKGLISNYIDLDTQLQNHGFDVTVSEIYSVGGECAFDFTKEKQRLSSRKEIDPLHRIDPVVLSPGSYVIHLNEVVKLPNDIMAVVYPRSSLLRSGVLLHSAVWDAGYHGRGELLLQTSVVTKLYRNARIGQMIFFRLSSETEGYNGTYQGEGL